MLAPTETSESLIRTPRLRPFQQAEMVSCIACQASITRWDRFLSYIRGGVTSIVNVAYCVGGKEPAEDVAPIERALLGREAKVNACAGVFEPHLHVTCRRCGNTWLMQSGGSW